MDLSPEPMELAWTVELEELGGLPADDVIGLFRRDPAGYRELYYAWERQQWGAASLELAEDAHQWEDEIDDTARSAIEVAYRAVCIAVPAADLLVPFVDSVPSEEQQVFMTTQLADTARHAVLQDRFVTEVAGHASSATSGRIEGSARLGDVVAGLLGPLGARARSGDEGAAAEGVVAYGLVASVGMAAAMRFLSEHLRTRGWLPGMQQGLNASLRDLARHVGFARLLATEHLAGRGITGSLSRHAADVVESLAVPGDLPYPSEEVQSYANELMEAMGRSAGIDLSLS